MENIGVRPTPPEADRSWGSDTADETSVDAKSGVGPEVRHHSLRKIPDIDISLSVDVVSGTTGGGRIGRPADRCSTRIPRRY
jgi:hypothetical protein